MTLYDDVRESGKVTLLGRNLLGSEDYGMEKPHKAFEMASFMGTLEREQRRSVSGTAAWKFGCYMNDQFHRYRVDDFFHQFKFVLETIENTKLADGTSLQTAMHESKDRLRDFVRGVIEELGTPDDEKIDEWVDYCYNYMMWEAWFYGGKVEAEVKDTLEREYGVRVLAISQTYSDKHERSIAAETGIERPEARGIDLWIPEWDCGIQVKTGDGGKWVKDRDDIDADILARVDLSQKESDYPVITFTPIE